MRPTTRLRIFPILGALFGLVMSAPLMAQRDCRTAVLDPSGSSLLRVQQVVRISATETEDMTIAVLLNPSLGERDDLVVSLRLQMPGGFLYQQLDVPVATGQALGNGPEASEQAVRGYAFPVPVARARIEEEGKGRRSLRVDVKVPLAGTPIVQNSLYGEWTVTPFLGPDAEAPCGRGSKFVLEP